MSDKQLYNICCAFFKKSKIKVNKTVLRDMLFKHPDYPSLAALADACYALNIEYCAVKVSPDYIKQHTLPLIAHLYEENGTFVIIEKIRNENVRYFHPTNGQTKEPMDVFCEKWDGIIFETKGTSSSIKSEANCSFHAKKNINAFSRLFIIVFVSILVGFSIMSVPHDQYVFLFYALFFIKIIALFICINIVCHEFGKLTKLAHKVCRHGNRIDCNEVLSSSGSKVFRTINLGDVGLVYFFGGIVCIIISPAINATQPIVDSLLFISLCSIPYIIYSVYYQAFVLKKWCILCVSILTCLLVECILFVITYDHLYFSTLTLKSVLSIVFCFLLTICSWIWLKPCIQTIMDGERYKYQYFRLKRNSRIFNALLSTSPPIEMNVSERDIIIDNSQSTSVDVLTFLINPDCTPCAKLHKNFEEIRAKSKKKFKFIYRFLAFKDQQIKEALHLIELYLEKGPSVFEDAVGKWFRTPKYQLLEKEYPVKEISQKAIAILRVHNEWARRNSIAYTPVMFFNNKQIDNLYLQDDIKWIILYLSNE